jgi:taurine transport system permease protein
MGASRHQVMWHVVLKAALPEILTGMRISIAFGWTTLVAAEMVAAKAGIGVMVLNAARFLATDIVFLGIVVIGLIAFFFDALMRRMERLLVPWKGKA